MWRFAKTTPNNIKHFRPSFGAFGSLVGVFTLYGTHTHARTHAYTQTLARVLIVPTVRDRSDGIGWLSLAHWSWFGWLTGKLTRGGGLAWAHVCEALKQEARASSNNFLLFVGLELA